jgi:hypothetical protein
MVLGTPSTQPFLRSAENRRNYGNPQLARNSFCRLRDIDVILLHADEFGDRIKNHSGSNFGLCMHPPTDGTLLPFPVHMKPYMVAGIRATREELRAALGCPHYVETDSTRTFGGDEDNWAWELPLGQRVLLVLRVPYCVAILHSDPPDVTSVVAALGIHAEKQGLEVFAPPFVDPSNPDG